MDSLRKIAIFCNEYPPHIYGGAGVHVEYLTRELATRMPVEVRCFGDQDVEEPNLRVRGYTAWDEMKRNTDPRYVGAVGAFARSLAMAKDRLDADIVHCHTWYTDMAGLLAGKLWEIPFVLTIHSLEPLRQLDLNGDIRIGQLKAFNLRTTDVKVKISADDGVLKVSPLTANLYEGAVDLDLKLDATKDTPRISVKETLTGVQVDARHVVSHLAERRAVAAV